jgi:hypothetical protein
MFTTQPLLRIGPAVYPRHLLIGKFFAMILVGAVVGYLIGQSMAADATRGAALTRDAYIENYDAYRADLLSSATPMAGVVAGGILFVIGALVTYEALSVFCAWGVAWIAPGAGPGGREVEGQ